MAGMRVILLPGLGSAIAGAPQPPRGRAEAALALHCAQRRPRIAGLQRQRARGSHWGPAAALQGPKAAVDARVPTDRPGSAAGARLLYAEWSATGP